MSVQTNPRWTAFCYRCHQEREVQTRYDHGAQVLCDRCASQPHRKPSASGLAIDLAAERAQRADQIDSGYQLLSIDDLDQLPAPDWVITGFLPEGLSVLFGAPSTFKSFIALDLALSVAAGVPWAGRPVRQGYVVFVAAEGTSGLKQRKDAWIAAHDDKGVIDELRTHAHFLPLSVDLLDPTAAARLSAALTGVPARPALVVIDTMARGMTGDENSAKDVGRFIAAVDALPASARLVVHHTGKDGSSERGSGALRGAADMMARLKREEQSQRVELSCDKAPKDGPAWRSMTLATESACGSLVLKPVSPFDAEATAEENRRKRIIEALKEQPQTQTAVERAVGGKALLVRQTLERMATDGSVQMTKHGQRKLFELPRPTLGDGVGTRSDSVPADDRVPRGVSP